jgi:hypothetical protein
LGGFLAHEDQFGEGTNSVFGWIGKNHGESPKQGGIFARLRIISSKTEPAGICRKKRGQ